MAESIRPSELPPGTPTAGAAVMFDSGAQVSKSTPIDLMNAARPLASQADAETGTDNAKIVSPLRVKQAIDALGVSGANLASTDTGKGAELVGFKQSGANTQDRTLLNKGRETVSPQDFTTPAAADADGRPLNVPIGATTTVANGAALSAIYYGSAQLQTADGNRRGKWFSQAKQRPASLGNHDSIDTAFNGDVSRSHFQVEHRISGDALGTPATGYLYTPEVLPHYTVLYVAPNAGHNQSTNSNDGRTGGAAYRVDLKHYGNGDIACYNGSIFVAGNKAGATHFLAQPAGVLFGGDMQAGANYVYFNPAERIYHDNGFDIACVHDVGNFHRENDTGGQSCVWGYSRPQSKGSKGIDFVYSFTGKAKVGLDFSGGGVDFGANQGAISLGAGQRIYGNNYSTNGYYTDGFNGDWISYASGGVGWIIAAGNTAALQVNSTQVSITVKAQMAGKVGMTGLGNYASDAAAAAAGVAVGELYHNAGALRVRLT